MVEQDDTTCLVPQGTCYISGASGNLSTKDLKGMIKSCMVLQRAILNNEPTDAKLDIFWIIS